MQTLNEQFDAYVTLCYPGGVNENQYLDLKKIWFAACHIMFEVIMEASEGDEEASVSNINDVFLEINNTLEEMITNDIEKNSSNKG